MPRFNSTKRPSALKETDYDHEILLLDHTTTSSSFSPVRTRSQSASDGEQSRDRDVLALPPGEEESRRRSDDYLRRNDSRASATIQRELARRKYGKYQENPKDGVVKKQPVAIAAPVTRLAVEDAETSPQRPATADSLSSHKKKSPEPERESAIDILYENERGGFLCGIPLFSSRALGAADSPAWVNSAFKPSATDPTTAQVPDPSWEWAWKGWSVNHQDDLDEDGWEYSFMYAKCCSWHPPHWYNSFVRRRAWVRKRVRKHAKRQMEAHRLNSDYFTIHPIATRSRSPSKAPSMVETRMSLSREPEPVVEKVDIEDIGALMAALKASRIDREKTEAVENFILNGGDDLVYLSEKMHDIMGQFLFQASRRSLLIHLTKLYEEESEAAKLQASQPPPTQNEEEDTLPDDLLHVPIEGQPEPQDKAQQSAAKAKKRLENIENAYHAADSAVKSLEYWSDIKDVAATGDLKGAVGEEQG